LKNPPVEQPKTATITTKQTGTDTYRKPTPQTIEKPPTTTKNTKKITIQPKHAINPIQQKEINITTTSNSTNLSSTTETLGKSPHHPTRGFIVPPSPTAGTQNITSPKAVKKTAPNIQATQILPTAPSPMRKAPFTTPVIEKPSFIGLSAAQSRLLSSQSAPGSTGQPPRSTLGNSSSYSGQPLWFTLGAQETMPPPIIPTYHKMNSLETPPIRYSTDQAPTTGLSTVAQTGQTPHGHFQPTTETAIKVHDAPPHASEPHLGQEEFPVNDHQSDLQDPVVASTHDSDEGYESTNQDIESDQEETTGQSNSGNTMVDNQDEASMEESTTTRDSNGASAYTQESQLSQPNQAVQETSHQSQSSDDQTTATNVTGATPPRNNLTDLMDCDSDDDADMEDRNLECPHPNHFKTFWRADYVTAIPTNTNPILAVAGKLGETLQILQTIDKDTSVYPYEADPSLKPINDPAAFAALGTTLYSYADKNNLWKYPKNEMKTCRLILCLAMNSDFRNTCEAFNRVSEDAQLYPRALNYPRIGRAGFFPMSHAHQMSERFIKDLRTELKRPIGLEWRKAVPSIDLSDADSKPGPNGRVDIPAAITVECRDGDEPAIRQRLTELFPAVPRADRFSYLCGMRMVFIHPYNPKEKDTVLPESKDNVARAWNLQKSANSRLRTASLNGIVRHPAMFDQQVVLDSIENPVKSLKTLILELKVPYVDTRKQYAPVFESVEYTRRRVLQKWEHPELFVVFLPQHEKYASNVVDNMAIHLHHQLKAPEEYLHKVFRKVHIRQQATRQWSDEHRKVFSQAHMSSAISDQHMAHHFADLNLDMSLVIQDAAKKQAATGAADAGSIPKASESQHLSMGMASLLGADDTGGDIFYRPASTPVTADISYASMVTQTPPNKNPPIAKSPPNTGDSRSKSRSSKPTTEEIEADRQRQSEKAKARTTMTPASKRSHKAPHQPVQDDLSAITADDTRPSAVATISVGTRSIDPSSITADTAALLQAQHEEMQAKLDAQVNRFNQYIQSQQNPPSQTTTPNNTSMSATAHNTGGGPAL
jgi:hypothetical protein